MQTSNIQPELNSLLTKLTAEIETDQKEIKIRQKRIKANEVLLDAVRGSLGVSNPPRSISGYGTKEDMLRAAIKQITKPRFTTVDVEAEIKRINPEIQPDGRWLRTALWTAANKKHELVKQVTDGTNRSPAEFEKLLISGSASGGSTANGHLTILRDEKNPRVSDSSTRPKSFSLAARLAIQQFPDRFGTKDIFDYCNQKWPGFATKNTDFSNALWALCKIGEIAKVEGSAGHNRNVYQKTKKFSAVTTA